MGDGEKLLTHLNSALKVLLGLDIFPHVPKKKKLNFVDQCYYLFIKNTILLYMFRASSAHFQEDTVVYMQHMAMSPSMRVPGGLSIRS